MTDSVNTDTQDTHEPTIKKDPEPIHDPPKSPDTEEETQSTTVTVSSILEGEREVPRSLCYYSHDLQELVFDAPFACHVEGVGTFLLFQEEANYLFYRVYDDTYRSWIVENLTGLVESDIEALVPINSSMVVALYKSGDSCYIFQTQSDWTDLQTRLHNKKDDKKIAPFLDMVNFTNAKDVLRPEDRIVSDFPTLKAPSKTPSQLANLRQYGRFDMEVKCSDGESIEAHTLVLGSQWIDLHQKLLINPELRVAHVPFSSLSMEPLISYFYDEQKPLEFMTAVAAVGPAEDYCVPTLLIQALRRIRQENLDVHQALEAWKLINSDQDNLNFSPALQLVNEYCAARIQDKLGDLKRSDKAQEMLKDMDKEMLILLYIDLSRCIGVEEGRRKERIKEF